MILVARPDRWPAIVRASFVLILIAAVGVFSAFSPLLAQPQDSTGIKRAFLDRYLDCAEAPDAAARLECYDALLVDIPTWLESPDDPQSSAIQTRAEAHPLDVEDSNQAAKH